MRVPKTWKVCPEQPDFEGDPRVRGFQGLAPVLYGQMKPQICICCGEPIAAHGQELSRNPNVCASCSSMADGMGETSVSSLTETAPAQQGESEPPPVRNTVEAEEEIILDWSGGKVSKSTLNLPK